MRTMMRTLAAVLLASLMLFGGAAAQAHDETGLFRPRRERNFDAGTCRAEPDLQREPHEY